MKTASLSLAVPKSTSPFNSTITSPANTANGPSSPASTTAKTPMNANMPESPFEADDATSKAGQVLIEDEPTSPGITSLPPFPSSPKDAPAHARERPKGLFSNIKASKSSNKVYQVEPLIRQVSEETPRINAGQENSLYSLRKSPGSTPDLSLSTFDNSSADDSSDRQTKGHKIPRRPVGSSANSDTAIATNPMEPTQFQKPKPRFGKLLNRTISTRVVDDGGRKSKPTTPTTPSRTAAPKIPLQPGESNGMKIASSIGPLAAPMTAPLQQDHYLRDMMNSNTRNRSADRQIRDNGGQENGGTRRVGPTGVLTSSLTAGAPRENTRENMRENMRENTGSHLLTNIKSTGSRAAGGLGRASRDIFNRVGNRKEINPPKEEDRNGFRIINLPLVEQTRRTRISPRLEGSRDKTEFWMPALPWRCIDFLNCKGCEEEGLYRVPGSEVQIKRWQRRFDEEGDVDLFNEPELYDINTVGSMFKTWLRDLPTEIFPKVIQAKIATECEGAKEVPQLLKNELSLLPPWNYYLLFAITCHLSLLAAYSEKNKMNYSNLCICFQPALRVDGFCFQFLVQQWHDCWQGCWTERAALDEEYIILEGGRRNGNGGVPTTSSSEASSEFTAVAEERCVGSSASNKPSLSGRVNQARPPPLSLTLASEEQNEQFPIFSGPENGHAKPGSKIPELAPVKPLSPIGMQSGW